MSNKRMWSMDRQSGVQKNDWLLSKVVLLKTIMQKTYDTNENLVLKPTTYVPARDRYLSQHNTWNTPVRFKPHESP